MTAVRRARVSLVAGIGLATAVLVLELPLGEMARQQGQLALASHELARLRATDATLTGDVGSLRQATTVAAIAHADYGLVGAGQRAYAVVATGGSSSGVTAPALRQQSIPRVDLVFPSAASLGLGPPSGASVDGTTTSGSLWNRVLDRLEFWRWTF